MSDVNPVVAVLSSVVTLVAAFYMWQFTTFLATSFAEHPFQSDFYPIQRFSSLMRQIVVGGSSLFTGLTAATGIGVGALGIYVAITGGNPKETSPDSGDSDAAKR